MIHKTKKTIKKQETNKKKTPSKNTVLVKKKK